MGEQTAGQLEPEGKTPENIAPIGDYRDGNEDESEAPGLRRPHFTVDQLAKILQLQNKDDDLQLVVCHLDGDGQADAPAKAADLPKLRGAELERTQYLQYMLCQKIGDCMSPQQMARIQEEIKSGTRQAGNLDPKADETYEKYLQRITKVLENESKEGVYGPATQLFRQRYAESLDVLTRQSIQQLDAMQLEMPANCPLKLPVDQYSQRISPTLLQALRTTGELDGVLKKELLGDVSKPPTDAQLDAFDAGFDWNRDSIALMTKEADKYQAQQLSQLIKERKLPEGWQPKPGDNLGAYNAAAADMIDLYTRLPRYIAAMQTLAKEARYGDYPIELPRNTKLVIEYNGQDYTITDQEVNDPGKRAIFTEGKIKECLVPMPADLNIHSPENSLLIADARQWLRGPGAKVEQSADRLIALQKNPDAAIMYGDVELQNRMGLFDADSDNFICTVPKDYKPQPGDKVKVKPVNLVGFDFKSELVTDKNDPHFGEYKLTQTIQAEQAPPWAYLNIRALGIDKVGKPMAVGEPKYFKPDEFIAVMVDGKAQLIQAKDAGYFKNVQRSWYYGEKIVEGAFDAYTVADLVTTGGVTSASGRLLVKMAAKTATKEAVTIGTKEGALFLVKQLPKALAVAAAVANNAGARDTTLGRWANNYRTAYWTADLAWSYGPSQAFGAVKTGWKAIRGGATAAKEAETALKTLTTAEKIDFLFKGGEAVPGETLKALPWLKAVHGHTELGFKTLEKVLVADALWGLGRNARNEMQPAQRDLIKDLKYMVGDGRGTQAAERGAFNPNDRSVLQAVRSVFNSYGAALKEGHQPDVQKKINDIFADTIKAMTPGSPAEKKEELKSQLLGNITFSGDEIRDLERVWARGRGSGSRLSAQQISDLSNPLKLKDFPKPVREWATRLLEEKDKDLAAASRIALIYLNRDNDGKINDKVASRVVTVPGYERREGTLVATRSVELSLSLPESVEAMKRDLAKSGAGNRAIVLADCLTRIGGIDYRQLGATLQNVLRNPQATREEKMRALFDTNGPRMATVIDATAIMDAQVRRDSTPGIRAQLYNVSAADLTKTLEFTAKNDKEPDVRAAAAALLYGLKEKDETEANAKAAVAELYGLPEPKEQIRQPLLNEFNNWWQDVHLRKGGMSDRVSDFFNKCLEAPLPQNAAQADSIRERKLNAAISLSMMTPAAEKDVHKRLNKSIAELLNPANPVVSAKVLEALIPERLAALKQDDPGVVTGLRAKALEMLKVPRSIEAGLALAEALPKINALMDGCTDIERQSYARKLQTLLDIDNKDMELYPQVKVEAIKALVFSLGDQSALPSIRSHISATNNLRLGDGAIKAGETDARVREIALKGLEHLKDRALRSLINQNNLIETETDSATAKVLRDIRFSWRPEPTSQEATATRQRLKEKLIGKLADYPEIKNWGPNSPVDWMKNENNFPLFDRNEYVRQLEEAAKNANGWWYRKFHSDATCADEENKAMQPIVARRMEQYNRLVQTASSEDAQHNAAQMVLRYMVQHRGGVGGSEVGGKSFDVNGIYLHTKVGNPSWEIAAAKGLEKCCDRGAADRKVTLWCLTECLLSGPNELHGEASMALLRGVRKLHDTGSLSRENAAILTAAALERELHRNPGCQNEAYQRMLLQHLRDYQHPLVYTALEEFGKYSQFAGLKQEANGLFAELQYSNNPVWNTVPADTVSTDRQRADRVKAALSDTNNVEDVVREIFKAYKDRKIANDLESGMNFLNQAMNDKSERIQMAAARVILNSNVPANHPLKIKAIQRLQAIQANGSNLRFKADAAAELMAVGARR